MPFGFNLGPKIPNKLYWIRILRIEPYYYLKLKKGNLKNILPSLPIHITGGPLGEDSRVQSENPTPPQIPGIQISHNLRVSNKQQSYGHHTPQPPERESPLRMAEAPFRINVSMASMKTTIVPSGGQGPDRVDGSKLSCDETDVVEADCMD